MKLKDYLFALALIALAGFVYSQRPQTFGGVGSDPSFGASGATQGATTCSAGTSTLVVAAQSGRTSFMAQLNVATSGQVVFLCRGSSCTANTGIPLVTTTPQFVQRDSYVGPYSCIAVTASTSLATSISQ